MGNILVLAPELSIIILAFVNLILGAFKAKHYQYIVRIVSILSILIALVLLIKDFGVNKEYIFNGMLVRDVFSNLTKVVILGTVLAILLLHFGISRTLGVLGKFEFPIIISLAVVGAMLMVSANNLLILYMGLELFSLPLYVATSFERNSAKSSEAGLKYFILGSFASGILLYGISLIYGFTGTIEFSSLTNSYNEMGKFPLAVIVGIVMVIISFCFKLSAAPFHMWAPDVYQGAPTLVTLFLSTVPKLTVISVFARLIAVVFVGEFWNFNSIITLVALLSMIVGAIGAINQKNIKRLLSYSSIGHIGFALIGLAIGNIDSIQALLVYIIIYIIMNLGAFAFILSMSVDGKSLEELEEFSGIAKINIDKGLAILIIMASMAGIPPLAGFFGKFYILNAAMNAKAYLLSFVGLLTTVISAYYYLKVIKVVFFNEPIYNKFDKSSLEVKFVLSLSLIFILFFCAYPEVIMNSSFVSALTLLMENT